MSLPISILHMDMGMYFCSYPTFSLFFLNIHTITFSYLCFLPPLSAGRFLDSEGQCDICLITR